MEKLSAELLFTGDGHFYKDKVLIHDYGRIVGVENLSNHDVGDVFFMKGILCPGFVNTHCHLELSHMKGRIDSGTGLLPFLKAVVGYRDIEQELIDEAIRQGDKEMIEAGIVAVGDISNKLDTAPFKNASRIAYHTFVEMFDFLQPSMTQATIAQYDPVYQGQAEDGLNKKSLVPHAPYTVSKELFSYIRKNNFEDNITVSIHNQETSDENQLFISGEGGFIHFYQDFGFSLDHFDKNGLPAIHYALSNMDPDRRTLFVHNTESTSEDIKAAQAWNNNIYWATCANANLYIENKLPDYQVFMDTGAKMTIGTDSLSSNWQLSILEEIKTIKKYKSYVPLHTLFQWATANGAEALGYEDHFGFFREGTKPGILQIHCEVKNDQADIANASVTRLI